jgi:hypothetical protein
MAKLSFFDVINTLLKKFKNVTLGEMFLLK